MPRPENAGRRYIGLEPTYVGKFDVSVWVNGTLQQKVLDGDKDKSLFKYECGSNYYGALTVKITVNSGKILISKDDAYGVYPCAYDLSEMPHEPPELFVGKLKVNAIHNVDWFYVKNKDQKINIENNCIVVEEGETIEYEHLIPNGPEWVDIFFNRERDKMHFLNSGFFDSKSDAALYKLQAENFVIDREATQAERTQNLIKFLQQKSI